MGDTYDLVVLGGGAGGYSRAQRAASLGPYCPPEIASVGCTEQALKGQGVACDKAMFPFRHKGRARVIMKASGHMKVPAAKSGDDGRGRLIGGPRHGPRATNVMAEGGSSTTGKHCPTTSPGSSTRTRPCRRRFTRRTGHWRAEQRHG